MLNFQYGAICIATVNAPLCNTDHFIESYTIYIYLYTCKAINWCVMQLKGSLGAVYMLRYTLSIRYPPTVMLPCSTGRGLADDLATRSLAAVRSPAQLSPGGPCRGQLLSGAAHARDRGDGWRGGWESGSPEVFGNCTSKASGKGHRF